MAAALHQNVEHVAILIHRSAKGMLLAMNAEDDLVEMPFVPTARATTAQFLGVGLPTLQPPLPPRFRGHHEAVLQKGGCSDKLYLKNAEEFLS